MSLLTPQPNEGIKQASPGTDFAPDVVLSIRYKPDGTVSWNIPADLIKCAFLLKILEMAVSSRLDKLITAAQSAEKKIVIPKRKLFGIIGGG